MATHSRILACPMDTMKRQKHMTPKDELPRSEGVQYVTEEEQRTVTNSSK